MNSKKKVILAHGILSTIYIFIAIFLDYIGVYFKVGTTYMICLALIANYGILVIISNEKDITKEQLSTWILYSLISSFVAFLLEWEMKGISEAMYLAFVVYGNCIVVGLGYRIHKNNKRLKLCEKINCLLLLIFAPYISQIVQNVFHWSSIVIDILPTYFVVACYYMVLKRKKIM